MTESEKQILLICQEECAEVIQMVSKIRRFGEFNHHPDEPELTNLARFKQELGDVIAMIDRDDVPSIHLNMDSIFHQL